MKPGRQKAILEILAEREIATQQQLLEALAQRDISCTQATLSRDLRDLGLSKQPGNGGFLRYALPPEEKRENQGMRLQQLLRQNVKALETAQNLVVLKTLPEMARAICEALDKSEPEGLAGTIAGIDTAFLAMRDNAAAKQLCREIETLLK